MGDWEQSQYPRFESCAIRIASYATWTQYDHFDKDALAQAGLYNNADGTTDAIQVRCFCCGQEFNNVSPEDDFLFQHFKRSPNCRYLRQKLGTNRIKEYQERIRRENQNQQQASRSPGEWTALDHIRSPQYATYNVRLASFARWPSDMIQRPEQVADAGFYYTGLLDVVRCFACDGGLKNWDPEDDPWIEHARWFPQCPFVQRVKGQEFINLVQRLMEESDEDEDADSKIFYMNNSVTSTSDLKREEDCDLLTTVAARSVIEFGYNANIVAKAINHLWNKGHSEPTAAQILEVILDTEDGGEMKCDENASSSPLLRNTSRLQCSDQSSAEERERLQQCIRCASCGRIEILFILCNNHSTVRNCTECKFICSHCSRAVRDRDT